jgi:hypothetical protein
VFQAAPAVFQAAPAVFQAALAVFQAATIRTALPLCGDPAPRASPLCQKPDMYQVENGLP